MAELFTPVRAAKRTCRAVLRRLLPQPSEIRETYDVPKEVGVWADALLETFPAERSFTPSTLQRGDDGSTDEVSRVQYLSMARGLLSDVPVRDREHGRPTAEADLSCEDR